MHCRFAKLEASQRKGRQTTVTLQAGGAAGGTCFGSGTITRHQTETLGLNFSFSIKAMRPPFT